MDFPLSAFEVYQKRSMKKRKVPPYQREAPEVKKPPKKQKKAAKEVRLNRKITVAQPIKIPNISKIKNKKNSRLQFENSDASSEDDIPTLIPIEEFDRTFNSETKVVKKEAPDITRLKKKQQITVASNGIHRGNGKIKKTAESIKESSKLVSPSPSDSDGTSIFNPVTHGLAVFKWLLDPVKPKEFFEKYWEKEVLYIKRSDKKYFEAVFSTEKLDTILREYPLHFTRNIDVVSYQNGKKEVVEEEGRALPAIIWDFYNNGCSVRILNPQTYDQNVHSIISSLQEYFGTMVGTNAYLTPPGSQGFAPHFDDIEAFIIQLEGTKCWKLYKPREEDVLARDSSQNFKSEDLPAPFMEVELNAGDLLYFPRGTIHEGCTKEGEHSLHITVSVYQHSAFVDLLEQALPAALKKAANGNLEFRKGLPLNYLKHLGLVNKNVKSKKREIIINKVKSLVNTLVNYLDLDSAADNLGRKFMHDAMPPLYSREEAQHSSKYDGDFMKNGTVFNRVEITPNVKVRLLRYYALRVVWESETTSKLYFCIDNAKTYHGEEEQWLELDNTLVPGVEMLQKQYPEFVEIDSLPIKDETEKLALISSLWEHGLLVSDGPLPSCDSDADSSSSDVSISVNSDDE